MFESFINDKPCSQFLFFMCKDIYKKGGNSQLLVFLFSHVLIFIDKFFCIKVFFYMYFSLFFCGSLY